MNVLHYTLELKWHFDLIYKWKVKYQVRTTEYVEKYFNIHWWSRNSNITRYKVIIWQWYYFFFVNIRSIESQRTCKALQKSCQACKQTDQVLLITIFLISSHKCQKANKSSGAVRILGLGRGWFKHTIESLSCIICCVICFVCLLIQLKKIGCTDISYAFYDLWLLQ